MRGIPCFVEVLDERQSSELSVCRKIMLGLLLRNLTLLPAVRSREELTDAVLAMKARGLAPSIFIVDTYLAEDTLAKIDTLIGPTPTLFLVRDAASESTLAASREGAKDQSRIAALLERLASRPMVVWSYSAANVSEVASKAAGKIAEFLNDGKFEHLSSGEHKAVLKPGSKTDIAALAAAAPPPGSMHGLLSQLSLSSLLMMFEIEKKSGELVLRRGDSSACVLIRNGRAISATAEGPDIPGAARENAEAVYLALTWKEGTFTFLQRAIEQPDTINTPTQSLLMESARRSDEVAK